MFRSYCADTGLSDAIRVHTHICACPNKAAQSYHCSHMHLASNYYVVIKLVFFAQTTCVRQTSGKLTATPLVIIFAKNFLTCIHSIYKNMGKCTRRSILQSVLVRVPRIQYMRTEYTLVRQRKCAG